MQVHGERSGARVYVYLLLNSAYIWELELAGFLLIWIFFVSSTQWYWMSNYPQLWHLLPKHFLFFHALSWLIETERASVVFKWSKVWLVMPHLLSSGGFQMNNESYGPDIFWMHRLFPKSSNLGAKPSSLRISLALLAKVCHNPNLASFMVLNNV